MRSCKVLANFILVLTLCLGLSSWASAKVVGHITKVQGRVDILKGGKLPAIPVKLQDTVEPGDVIRVKSLSRAQITFIDNSIITLSPRSRLAIKAYEFSPAKKERNVVLRIFQGLAHVVVSKIYKVEQPDFIIETNTAVAGVRGTDFGVRLQPDSSTILNFEGLVQVANIFPEVGELSRRIAKVAYAFPPASVLLKAMQGTTVGANLPPTLPFTVTNQDKMLFKSQMVGGSVQSGTFSSSATGKTSATTAKSTALTSATGNAGLTALNTVTVPPIVVPRQQTQNQTSPTPSPADVAIPVFNILLEWGAGAYDLDLHLTGPQPGGTFEVYYNSLGSLTSQPYAQLHQDDTGYSGSEVITVQQFNQGGTYEVFVYDYGNTSGFSPYNPTQLSTTAGASLSVINGGTVTSFINPNPGPYSTSENYSSTVQGGTTVATLTPIPSQVGNTWYAVTIDPATGKITLVNYVDPPGISSASKTTTGIAATSLSKSRTLEAANSAVTTSSTGTLLSAAPATKAPSSDPLGSALMSANNSISSSAGTWRMVRSHRRRALVAHYINHTAIANIGSEAGEFAPTLTTASINAVLDEGVVPGDTGATFRGARNIRTMTHRHRTAWVHRHRGPMAFQGHDHFHGHHRGPMGLHHRAFAHNGPMGLHHWAFAHGGPMALHHRGGFHRGPNAIPPRALRHAPLCRRNMVPRVPHHLPAGPKLNLAQKAH